MRRIKSFDTAATGADATAGADTTVSQIKGADADRLRKRALVHWEQYGFLWGVRYEVSALRPWLLEQVRSNGAFERALSFTSRAYLVNYLIHTKLKVPKGWHQKEGDRVD
ncbi:MAG: hypothetical protein ACYCYO_02135 [Bacilli bacterium]